MEMRTSVMAEAGRPRMPESTRAPRTDDERDRDETRVAGRNPAATPVGAAGAAGAATAADGTQGTMATPAGGAGEAQQPQGPSVMQRDLDRQMGLGATIDTMA